MNDSYLISVISISALSILGALGFQRIYNGKNWILRHIAALIGLLLLLFTATFSAINGYGVDELMETYIGRPVAKFLGYEVSKKSSVVQVAEPVEETWLYQSGNVGGAFATEIKGAHALLIINCEKRSSNPYLSLSINLPDFVANQQNILAFLEKENSVKGYVEMEFQLGRSLRYQLEMMPVNYNQSGQADTWDSGHTGDSTSSNAVALRELIKAMVSRNSVISLYSAAYGDHLPFAVSTHGLRFLAQETKSLDHCLQS